MSGHADLAPSAAHRWMRCPGSVPMSKGIGDRGSSYAAEGTWAHKLAEVRLEGRESLTEDETADLVGLTGETYDTAAMADHVGYYVDYVRGLGGDLFTEQRLSLTAITGEEGAAGTADAVILRGSELVIADLKYGQGVKVDAVENPQLTIYAGAALGTFAPMMEEELAQIRLIIIQPRLDHVSEWVLTPAELEDRLAVISKAAAEARREMATDDMDQWHFCPGLSQCRFCPARGRCRELARFALTAAGLPELKGTVPKLDTCMIHSGVNGEPDYTMVRTLTKLFHDMDLVVIAEGVETEKEVRALEEQGVDRIQGFALAKPMPQDALVEFYRNHPMNE